MEIKGGENKKSGREDTFVECGSEVTQDKRKVNTGFGMSVS